MQVWFRPARMHGHPERTPIKATITKDRGNGIVDLTYDDGEFSGNARAVPNALRLPRNVREQVAVWWDVGFEMDFQTAVDNSLKKKKDDPPPQPSPTPQTDSQPAPVLDRDRIREIFMAHGFTVKEGQTDLKQYVYDAAHALLELVAAPQQEAQEPVAWQGVHDQTDLYYTKPLQADVRPLYAAPQPAPAELERLRERIARMGLDVDRAMRGHVNEQSPLGTTRLAAIAALAKPAPAPLSDDTKDAARYRWLRNKSTVLHGTAWLGSATAYQRDVDFLRRDDALAELDAAIDAALAAQGGK